MKLTKKILCVVLAVLLIAGCCAALAACNNKVILVWGPGDHEELYMQFLNKFAEEHKEQLGGYHFEYAGSGDAGAYGAMNIDPTTGAGVYTFANDQMANLRNLGALAEIRGDNLAWSKENNDPDAVDATILGANADGTPRYYAYPLQADNGYYMYYNKAAFKGAPFADSNGLINKPYTFRDMYEWLESKSDTVEADGVTNWHNGLVTWAIGDSWYVSGVFFSVGGDYDVQYDSNGKQKSAECWFAYHDTPADWRDEDMTIGFDAYECLKNSITDANGKVSSHYLYTDGDKAGLNDFIDTYSNKGDPLYKDEGPLAAAVCGTWKAKQLRTAWGDDYAATVLPMLETDDGEMFQMKNFRGYKHMGVNPMCKFAQESAENLALLHELAQYLCGLEPSIARYEATGAGPALKAALQNEKVASDAALTALNNQYNIVCNYPANYSNKDLVGKPIGNGKGYRDQDSVPANYWTPIQQFGNALYNELSGKTALSKFKDEDTIRKALQDLQAQIRDAAQ